MKCKWIECKDEARAKSPFCGDTCKKRYQRRIRANGTSRSGTNVPVKVGQEASGTQPGQTGTEEAQEQKRIGDRVKQNMTSGFNETVLTPVIDRMAELLKPTLCKPANFGQPDCECQHCGGPLPKDIPERDQAVCERTLNRKHVLNHGAWKTVAELGDQELNRVSLPGDVDYKGVAV